MSGHMHEQTPCISVCGSFFSAKKSKDTPFIVPFLFCFFFFCRKLKTKVKRSPVCLSVFVPKFPLGVALCIRDLSCLVCGFTQVEKKRKVIKLIFCVCLSDRAFVHSEWCGVMNFFFSRSDVRVLLEALIPKILFLFFRDFCFRLERKMRRN